MGKDIKELITEFEKVCENIKQVDEILKGLTRSDVTEAEEKMKESAGSDDFEANLRSYVAIKTKYSNAISDASALDGRYKNLEQLIYGDLR